MAASTRACSGIAKRWWPLKPSAARRIVFAEGEDERVLRAVQTVLDEGLARPVLIGNRSAIIAKAAEMALRLDFDKRVEILDPGADRALFGPLVERYQGLVSRRGIPPLAAERRPDPDRRRARRGRGLRRRDHGGRRRRDAAHRR